MIPNYERAAIKATETLIKFKIDSSPVSPFPMLKRTDGVFVVSFAEMSNNIGIERKNILTTFRDSQDAVTSVFVADDKLRYIVAYNQMLPFYMLQRALARELGHIVLGHDGTLPDEVQAEEARCFAHHLICPRPLIHLVMSSGIRFTTEVLGNLTGCYERCLFGMRRLPKISVPAELNRAVRDNLKDYLFNFFEYQRIIAIDDASAIADFGSYMEGYEE